MLSIATPVLASAFVPGVVMAEQKGSTLDFCTGNTNCVTLNVQNVASVTVQSVTVSQLADAAAGCVAEDKRHTANLRGRTQGDWFAIKANKACSYKIKFVTPDGCTGNKTAKLTKGDVAKGYVVAKLKRACGSLIAEPDKTRYHYASGTVP